MSGANAILFISVLAGAVAVRAAAEQRAEARGWLEQAGGGPDLPSGADDAAAQRWVAVWQARAATLSLVLAIMGLALLALASYLHARS